jgi:hypothetical protein
VKHNLFQNLFHYGYLPVHLNAAGLCNFNYFYEVGCFLYNFHKMENFAKFQ